jgi:acetolactate synthase-1/2/3 large subunit
VTVEVRVPARAAPPGTLSAAHLLLRYLEQEGVDCLFGIPGGPLMPLYNALFERGKIRPILAKHEAGAAFMADGYARVSGRLGLCATTTGPGATNAVTGIACARRDSVPVLIITAQIALAAFGKGAAQESTPMAIDIVDLYKGVTKASVMALSADKVADMARMLLRTALTGRPGPIHLSFPADMMETQVPGDVLKPDQYRPTPELFDRRTVREAAGLLLKARRPAILAGYGVHISRAYDELRSLAERLRIPVATTQKGKGVFPEDHILSLGVFGFAGSPQADAVLLDEDTDLLLGVGTGFGELATHAWDPRLVQGRRLLQIDVDPAEIGKNYPVTVGLVGDARQVLREVDFQIERDGKWVDGSEDAGVRLARVRAVKTMAGRWADPKGMDSLASPLHPARVVAELRRALPDDGILFTDIGNVMAWALHYFTVREPGTFFINMGFGSMGHAVAASIGGKLAAPRRAVVALVGDAAFAMNGMEVHTAVENRVGVVWVVMNNGGHGMVRLGEKVQFKGRFSSASFEHPLDVAAMAEAMGAVAYRADKPSQVERAVRDALALGRPAVVDVRVDPDIQPPMGVRLATLDKFFNREG